MEENTQPSTVPAPPPGKGWWSRNWKWVVPSGCLGCALLFAIFIGAILLIVFSAMKSSDVYKFAVHQAQNDPRVQAALGTPVDTGLLLSGNTNVNGAAGDANLAIPLSGPKGKGTLYVVAKKSAGLWNYSEMVVEIAQTKERISLGQHLDQNAK